MIRINYQSDFSVRVTIKSADGTVMQPPTDHAWWLHIADDMGTCFRCGFDGSSYEDCRIDGDTVVCYVNNPGYVPGLLHVTYMDVIPDSNYSDGYNNQVAPAVADVMLWDGATDDGASVDIDLLLQVIAPRVTAANVTSVGDLVLTFNN